MEQTDDYRSVSLSELYLALLIAHTTSRQLRRFLANNKRSFKTKMFGLQVGCAD